MDDGAEVAVCCMIWSFCRYVIYMYGGEYTCMDVKLTHVLQDDKGRRVAAFGKLS